MVGKIAQGRLFNQVAKEYDLYRPGYPLELVETILSISAIKIKGRILEVGSGTGKATLPFASRGYIIRCIEPGKDLIAVAQAQLKSYPDVTFEQTTFEEASEQSESADLVISAQAWHWVDPTTGYAKAARILNSSGWLALFWNMYTNPPDPIFQEIQEVYRIQAPQMVEQDRPYQQSIQEREAAINASGLFGPVLVRSFPWTARYTSRQYIGLLDTYSDHLALPDPQKQSLYHGITAVIDHHGGEIVKPYLAVVHMAGKRSG